MRADFIEVNNTRYPVKIFIESRKNVSVSIGKKAVNIRVPYFLNREELARQILQMKMWAKEKLMEKPQLLQKQSGKTYKDGDILKVGGKEYALNISFRDKESSSARITDDTIYLVISANLSEDIKNKHISTLLSRCVARKRINALKSKIDELNQKHFNQKVNKIFFKYNKSNWGSCSKNRNINISTRLLFASEDVLEYVCIHELAHLIEHNHSEKFWSLVEKAMPDYKKKEKWLKENRNECIF